MIIVVALGVFTVLASLFSAVMSIRSLRRTKAMIRQLPTKSKASKPPVRPDWIYGPESASAYRNGASWHGDPQH